MAIRLCIRCRRVPLTAAQRLRTGREATHCPACLRARLREERDDPDEP